MADQDRKLLQWSNNYPNQYKCVRPTNLHKSLIASRVDCFPQTIFITMTTSVDSRCKTEKKYGCVIT